MRIMIPLLVIIGLLISCKKEVPPSNNRGTAVTLLLIKPKNNVMRKNADGSTIGIGRPGDELSIIDSMNMLQKINIHYDPQNDTILIEPHRKHIQVNFLYKVFDVFSYVFEAGDSVIVDYQEGYPRVKIINRSTLPWDYDWERYTRKNLYKDEAKQIESGIVRIRTTNSVMVDYRIAFDKVVLSTEFSRSEKDMLYLHYMEQMISFFSKSDIEKYLPKFNENITNKALNSYLISIYNLDFNSSKELRLKNINEEILTFEQVLKKQKGNLVYVDFWASWCAPCIASFPDEEKLKHEYKNRNVSFIYLSIDKDFGSWKKASSKYGMADSDTYLVDNRYVSEMMEDLQITSIPRYLVYDSKGNLIHKNAPGPKGGELGKFFNKHLQEKPF